MLTGTAQGHAPVQFNFSTKTETLKRLVRWTGHTYGAACRLRSFMPVPSTNGVKVPFRVDYLAARQQISRSSARDAVKSGIMIARSV